MSLPPKPTYANWTDPIEEVAKQFRNATIRILDPDKFTVDAPYNPVTDTGGNKQPVVVWEGAARIEAKRPRGNRAEASAPADTYHFDIGLDPKRPHLVKGMRIRVLENPVDPILEKYSFSIGPIAGGSWAHQRVIVATSEGAVVYS